MIFTKPLEMTDRDGRSTGRWRLIELSDEHDGAEPLCDCGGRAHDNPATAGHATPDEATACPVARAKVDARQGFALDVSTLYDVPNLACVAFEAYGASTGGKTWDGKPIPPFDDVRVRTPHVAAAWEAAVVAILNATRGVSR